MRPDIYEHFDFDVAHLKPGNLIYSQSMERWISCSPEMWDCLLSLKEIFATIKDYRTNVHDGKNLETAKIYSEMMEGYAKAKKVMQVFANEFCIKYKGYSLN